MSLASLDPDLGTFGWANMTKEGRSSTHQSSLLRRPPDQATAFHNRLFRVSCVLFGLLGLDLQVKQLCKALGCSGCEAGVSYFELTVVRYPKEKDALLWYKSLG